ncbi:pentapeptide repeat-containing protein [Streptosporangiaceae bacterium NEAU-GS5]|nr:pentapeptide repeat-containing protein [Streptosporangiaceae bacterium NEAU-GS5]
MRRFIPLVSLVSLALLAVLSPAAHAAAAAAAPCKPGSGPNLRGKNFTSGSLPASLRCADLTGAKLDGVDLTQKDLTGAILRNASLTEADLTQAYLEYADLRGADLTEADLGQLRAKQADLRKAILVDADAGQAEFPHADLSGAFLTRAVLTQANLTDAKLVDADLREANLTQVKARTADFTRAKLNGVSATSGSFQHATFVDADLTKGKFTVADMQGADLTGAIVEGTSFTMAQDLDLTGVRGEGSDLPTDAITHEAREPGETGDPINVEPASRPDPKLGAMILVVASAVGLVATLLIWGASARRRKREAAYMAVARAQAEEDVTRFGEEIDTLDFDMKVNQVSGPTHDWRIALDAYEAAKRALAVARTRYELYGVANAVQQGRAALTRVRALR